MLHKSILVLKVDGMGVLPSTTSSLTTNLARAVRMKVAQKNFEKYVDPYIYNDRRIGLLLTLTIEDFTHS